MAPFNGWGSTAPSPQSHYKEAVHTTFHEFPGTYLDFINPQ